MARQTMDVGEPPVSPLATRTNSLSPAANPTQARHPQSELSGVH